MKKIFLLITAALMTAGIASAQDINEATANYNNGATELQMGNLEAAVTYFQTALEMGQSLGEPAAELVENCKSAICSVTLAMAKELYNAKDFAAAVEAFNKAKEVAETHGNAEMAAEAEELAAQANKLQYNTAGTAALRAKDYPTAIEAFTKVLELEPDNGNAALQLGQAYYRNNQFVAETLESKASFKDFVEVDKDARKGTYVRYPERKELNQEINESLVVEYYNRKM